MNSAKQIVEDLRTNAGISSFNISKVINLLGDIEEEEYLFYSTKGSCFYRMIINWDTFNTSSFHKATKYLEVSEDKAMLIIDKKLKDGIDG